ncbi:MAG TPA: zf-HC2 domain-containing protein [Planctomycetota bacterium]|nr:zf-HC2 domain-containing protein [Planctomycetota bacterium]
MSCAGSEESLVHRALGELGDEEARALEAHLAACGACREEAARADSFLARLRRIEVPGPSHGFEARTVGRLASATRRERVLPFLRDLLGRSAAARVAAALLLIQAIGLPVLAMLLVVRDERPATPEIGYERRGEPLPERDPEPPVPIPGVEEGEPGAPLAFFERIRGLVQRRSADASERASLLARRRGGPWVEEELSRALARLRLDPAAFGDPARTPFVYLALVGARPHPGAGPDAARLADLAARLAPRARAGEVAPLYALWEGFLAGIGSPEPILVGLKGMRNPAGALEAALALRLVRDAEEVEAIEASDAPEVEELAARIRSGSRPEWGPGLLAFGQGNEPGEAPLAPDLRAAPLETAFAARGLLEKREGPHPLGAALERVAREGRFPLLGAEAAALLLETYYWP